MHASMDQKGRQEMEWIPLGDVVPASFWDTDTTNDSPRNRKVRACDWWFCVSGSVSPSPSDGPSVCHVIIDPALRVSNTLPYSVELRLADCMGSEMSRLSEITECRLVDLKHEGVSFFSSGHVVYVFDLATLDGPVVQTEKRYSEFDDFHTSTASLHDQCGERTETTGFPNLPDKTYFGSDRDIRERSALLQIYLNRLIEIGNHVPEVAVCLRGFLLSDQIDRTHMTEQAHTTVKGDGDAVDLPLDDFNSLSTTIGMHITATLGATLYETPTASCIMGGERAGGNAKHTVLVEKISGNTLVLRLENHQDVTGCHRIKIYSDYLIVNTSGLPIRYQQAGHEKHSYGLIGPTQLPSKRKAADDVATWMFDCEAVKPTVFSFLPDATRADVPARNKQLVLDTLALDNGAWMASKPFGIDGVGSVGEIECVHGGQAFQLGVSISTSPGNILTKQIRFSPRFIICNHINGFPLNFAAMGAAAYPASADVMPLTIGAQAVHLSPPDTRKIALAVVGRSIWSGTFAVDQIRDFPLLLRDSETEAPLLIVRVQIKLFRASMIIHLSKQWQADAEINETVPQQQHRPTYACRNLCRGYQVRLSQHGSNRALDIPAGKSIVVGWDAPEIGARVNIVCTGILDSRLQTQSPDYELELDMDKLQGATELANSPILHEVVAVGITKVLIIRDAKADATSPAAAPPASGGDALAVSLTVPRVGVSLVRCDRSHMPVDELLYLTFLGLTLEFAQDDQVVTTEVKLNHFQLDNMTDDGSFPVVLYPKHEPDRASLHLQSIQNKSAVGVKRYEYFTVLLQALDIKLELSLLMDLKDFAEEMLSGHTQPTEQERRESERGIQKKLFAAVDDEDKLYFEILDIQVLYGPTPNNPTILRIHL
jgi:hypothetical protein